MVSYVYCCISFFTLCFSQIYVWAEFYNKKVNFKNIMLYISLFFMFSIGMFNYFFVSAFFRMFFNFLLFFMCNYLIFKRRVNEVVISALYTEFLMTVLDIILSLILLGIFKFGVKIVIDNSFITYSGNIFVSILLVFICKLSIIKKLYNKLVSFTSFFKMKYLIIICIFLMISMNFVMATIYFDLKPIFIVLINSCLIFVYSFIIYRALNEKNNSMIIKAENDSLMDSLHQYEDMVDRQRVDNHENKNQLLIIKNMINKKDKDVIKYIDTIVKNQKEDDEALYTRVMSIPSGGLQGIIYQKMLVMKDERIKFNLNVSRDVRNFELDKLSMDDNYRLCKIVGVFLDNAIEESRRIENKFVMISLYIDDNELVIEVSNKFEGKIDVDLIDNEGFTTKGDGHGYGLSLVKEIISESDVFENVRSISRNTFKQVIKIKNT